MFNMEAAAMLCFFPKTRQSSTNCRGILRKVNKEINRSEKIPLNDLLCQHHYDEIRRRDNKRCSCPSTWGHSKSLHPHPIPTKYFQVLDKAGETVNNYIPGTRWCNECHKTAPKRLLENPESNLAKIQKVRCSLCNIYNMRRWLFA